MPVLLLLLLAAEDPRQTAINKAMRFLDQTAANQKHLRVYGHDLLWAFSSIARTAGDPKLRKTAQEMGERHARKWRKMFAQLPAKTTADEVTELLMGDYSCKTLGVLDAAFTKALGERAKQFSTVDFLGYDPRQGAPSATEKNSAFDRWSEALIITYFGDSAGVTLGTPYKVAADAMPPLQKCEDIDVFYAFTHVIYTRNDYGVRKLPADSLKMEMDCIKAYLPIALADNNPEVVGEALDSMKALGMTEDPAAVAYLLKTQKADGSWVEKSAPIYTRYHSAWTGIDGLRSYLFQN